MGGMNGKLGLADWRWLFIIEGTIPIPVAVLTYFTLPDYPATTKWLTDEERQLATLRITEEAVEEDDRGEATAWQDKHRKRWLHIVWPQVFCSVGFIISATTLNVAARYTATFMMMSVYGSFGCILSWVSTTLPRPSTKRAVSYAVVNAGSNLASIYASYFYPKSHGPQYWQANILNVAFAAMCILLATILHFYLRWRNRKLRRAGDEDLQADGVREGSRSRALGERWQCHPVYQYTL
ncbi:hypothetical protein COL940_012192 [Colletotrichum noveboracense]|nr:hypothetical protein COL940_012192 [Colletotrichum noveboracense]